MIEGEIPQILKLILALVFVLSLMGGLALLLRKLGLSTMGGTSGNKRRIKIIEALALDARRRAVILQCDQKQYLVIMGPNGETLVDSNLSISGDNEHSIEKS